MVHHKYLDSLVGYCLEPKHQILVYEFAKEGDLRKRLKGTQYGIEELVFRKRKWGWSSFASF